MHTVPLFVNATTCILLLVTCTMIALHINAEKISTEFTPGWIFPRTIQNAITALACVDSFAIHGDVVAIGCSNPPDEGDPKSVSIFRFSWTTFEWELEHTIETKTPGFGDYVGLYDNMLGVVENDTSLVLYWYVDGTWVDEPRCVLNIPDIQEDDNFGVQMILRPDRILISADGTDNPSDPNITESGIVYSIPLEAPCTFGPILKIQSPIPTTQGYFGYPMVSNGLTTSVLIGGPQNFDGHVNCSAGVAYFYHSLSDPTPSQRIDTYDLGITDLDCDSNLAFPASGSIVGTKLIMGSYYGRETDNISHVYRCDYVNAKWKNCRDFPRDPDFVDDEFGVSVDYSEMYVNPTTQDPLKLSFVVDGSTDMVLIYDDVTLNVIDYYNFSDVVEGDLYSVFTWPFHMFIITDNHEIFIYQNVEPHTLAPTPSPTDPPTDPPDGGGGLTTVEYVLIAVASLAVVGIVLSVAYFCYFRNPKRIKFEKVLNGNV